jgi:hypothetical protein
MKETERKPKISLEDLLQIKRAERPPAEFWSEFEQSLRAKQLAAIVGSRPWWRTLVTSKNLVRWCVPLGATAVVAMTFSSFRGSRTQATASNAVVAVAESNRAAGASDTVAQATKETSVAADVARVGASTLALSDRSTPAQLTQITNDDSARQDAQSPTRETNAATPAGFVLAQLGTNANPESAPLVASRALVIEPLAQVATPRDSRRTRLLAYSVTFDPHAADSSDSVRSRERITHRISDESIYDSITRLGLSGDRVSIKF